MNSKLFKGSAGVLFLQIAGIFFSLAISMLLTRALGVQQFGLYNYVLALISILVIPAQFGVATLIVRETAKAEAMKEWGTMKGVWLWSSRISLVISCLLIFGSILYFNFFSANTDAIVKAVFISGCLLIPLISLNSMREAALRGLRRVVLAQLPDSVFRPITLILLILIVMLINKNHFSAKMVISFNVISTFMAFLFGVYLLKTVSPPSVAACKAPKYMHKAWLLSVLPLSLLEGVNIINAQTDIVMLGIFGTMADVGIYKVAFQGAYFTTLGLTAISTAATPYFSQYHAEGNIFSLAKTARNCARGSMILALPVFILFYFWGDVILGLLFGQEFKIAYRVLLILSTIQLINAAFGTSGRILNMCGYEKDTLLGMSLAAVINIILNYLLIPKYGAIGAAMGTGTAILFKNFLLWFRVYKRLNIDSSILGLQFKAGNI